MGLAPQLPAWVPRRSCLRTAALGKRGPVKQLPLHVLPFPRMPMPGPGASVLPAQHMGLLPRQGHPHPWSLCARVRVLQILSVKDDPASSCALVPVSLTSLKCMQMLAPLSQVTCVRCSGAALEIKTVSSVCMSSPCSILQADSSALTHQRIP